MRPLHSWLSPHLRKPNEANRLCHLQAFGRWFNNRAENSHLTTTNSATYCREIPRG